MKPDGLEWRRRVGDSEPPPPGRVLVCRFAPDLEQRAAILSLVVPVDLAALEPERAKGWRRAELVGDGFEPFLMHVSASGAVSPFGSTARKFQTTRSRILGLFALDGLKASAELGGERRGNGGGQQPRRQHVGNVNPINVAETRQLHPHKCP